MLKIFLKRHKKKGFTLTETIVVVALIALIMACVVGFSSPVLDLVKGTNAKSDAVTINKIIANYVEHRLAYANYIRIDMGCDPADYLSKHSDLSDTVKKLKKSAVDPSKNKGRGYISGLLLFHFDENDGTYRLYDIDANKEDIKVFVEDKMKGKSASALKELLKPYRVFSDDFYNPNYSYFIRTGSTVESNPKKSKAYMSVEVTSFDLNLGYTNNKFTTELAVSYFKELANASGNEKDAFENSYDSSTAGITGSMTGTEKNTFSFENISYKTSTSAIMNRAEKAKDVKQKETDTFIFYSIRRDWKSAG